MSDSPPPPQAPPDPQAGPTPQALGIRPAWDLFTPGGMRLALAAGFVALAASAASIALFDRRVALWVEALDPAQRRWAYQWTDLAKGEVPIVGGLLAAAGLALARRRVAARWALVLAGGAALGGILSNLFKLIFGRARPKMLITEDLFGFQAFTLGYDFNSFPSGHSTISGAMAGVMLLASRRWGWLGLPLGGALATTRIFTNSHYIADVIAGFLLGLLSAAATASWVRRWPAIRAPR